MFTCLRFENDRGLGWEISKERARSIVHEANRNGLMQSGELGLTPDGSLHGAICNCCVDCCYPLQAAARLGAEKRWPFTRFIARYRGSECNGCSRCARRCPFGAFEAVTDTTAGDDRPRRRGVRYHAVKCRGCGLCATGCPEAAIVMEPVDDPLAASFPLNSHRTP